jgi:anaerobic selenocysteine-containing dehydrogenase
VLILSGANPVFNLPDVAGFREAIEQIPLVVSLSSFIDETSSLASLVLPSHTYLESWGDSFPEPGVGFSIGAISQPVVSPLFNTKATGDIILGLAQESGLSAAFPWPDMKAYLKEGWQEIYARGNAGDGTEGFEPFWTDVVRAGVWGETVRGSVPVGLPEGVVESIGVESPEFSGSSADYPFILHPYLSPTLEDGSAANLPWMQELPDPLTSIVYGSWIELNPQTANELNLEEGDVVEIDSPHGQITAPIFLYPAIMPNVIGMPIGQGHTNYGRYASGRGANPVQILSPQLEAETGDLAWAATRVAITLTGRRVEIVKTGGVSRELGRGIVQKVSADGTNPTAGLSNIPVKVVRS